jgi:fructose-specific phosphotransferase system component IIB
MTSDFPIIFIGKDNVRSIVEVHQIGIKNVISAHRVGAAKLVADAYGIKLSSDQVARLKAVTTEEFLSNLAELALSGRVVGVLRKA